LPIIDIDDIFAITLIRIIIFIDAAMTLTLAIIIDIDEPAIIIDID
jgi:hypothetical protein